MNFVTMYVCLWDFALSDCDPGTWNLIGWEGNICIDLFGTGEVELLEG